MKPTHVLVVGASGSIGRHAVEKARAAGYRVRALGRDPSRIHFGCGV
ncbi:NAD(P)H-binding protein, partial [Escherichia coli]|nr:NAD(P)H-binding protein [Escherichia coli]